MPDLLKVALQTVALYVFLIVGFRFLGRRLITEISPTDLFGGRDYRQLS